MDQLETVMFNCSFSKQRCIFHSVESEPVFVSQLNQTVDDILSREIVETWSV